MGGDHTATVAERIEAAVRELLQLRPFDQITVAEIAARAGVSARTVYRHIGNKDQLKARLGHPEAAEETRARLLAAAAQAFAQTGYAAATLDDVARIAGLTKGAVYWHFKSKMDLFIALMDERIQRQLVAMPDLTATASHAGDPVESLAAILTALLASIQADPNWPRLYLEFLAHSRHEGVGERLSQADHQVQAYTAHLFRRLQQDGVLAADLAPEWLAVFFTALLDGVALAWLKEPQGVEIAAWTRQLARLLWFGMAPAPQS